MNEIKNKCKQIEFDWFILIETFGKLGVAIKTVNKISIEKDIVRLMSYLLKIASDNDINMHHAWHNWKIKALSKQYSTNNT